MKIILTGDWHFGKFNNSKRHNEDLLEFIEFMGDYAREHNIPRLIHLGDYFDERNKINVDTLDYARRGINRIAELFDEEDALKGNHDLYYRDMRDVSPLNVFTSNLRVHEGFDIEGDMMFVPWVCTGEEWDRVINMSKEHNIRFIFGHLELTSFKMNDNYIMEHGYSHKELRHVERVFTGHYHMRQIRDNVVYVGSPFPFDMNDANDTERGFCVLDTDTGEFEFVNYTKLKVRSVDYREFLKEDFEVDPENTTIRIVIEETVDDTTLELVNQKKAELPFRDAKVDYKGNKHKEAIEQEVELEDIMGIDEAVLKFLGGMTKVADLDPKLMASLYREAMDDSQTVS